jgi:hypothetical protein
MSPFSCTRRRFEKEASPGKGVFVITDGHENNAARAPRTSASTLLPSDIIRGQEAGHPVIRNMHAISALINEDGNRSIRAGIRNVLSHLLHDERISNDETNDSG